MITNDSYQTVTLVLADGRRCSYTGRAQMESGLLAALTSPTKVVDILVSEPQLLPNGMTWENMTNLEVKEAIK